MPFEVNKMRDGFDKIKIHHKNLFDLPMKGLIISKSQIGMGKSNLIGNFLLKDDGYKQIFEPDNIYIINPSTDIDKKFQVIIEELEIPRDNVFTEFSNEVLNDIYELLQDEGKEELNEKNKIAPKLVIMDDCSFGGALKAKRNGSLARLFCNGRHLNISIILTSQKYTDIPNVCRENATFVIAGSCSQKQLDLIIDDHNILPSKKDFTTMFRKTTEEPYSFLVVNYGNKSTERYLDKDFNVIPLAL
jgi:hypothetical protein